MSSAAADEPADRLSSARPEENDSDGAVRRSAVRIEIRCILAAPLRLTLPGDWTLQVATIFEVKMMSLTHKPYTFLKACHEIFQMSIGFAYFR